MTRRGHRRILNRQRSQRRQFAAADFDRTATSSQRSHPVDEISITALAPIDDSGLPADELLSAA